MFAQEQGANLKKTKEMNQALLARMAWRLLSCSGELWREVLCAKYKINKETGANFVRKYNLSHIWKGLVWGGGASEEGVEVENQ